MTTPPILVSPTIGETLLLYVAASACAVSTALVAGREEEGHALKVQIDVYFISEVLSDSKTPTRKSTKFLYIVLISKLKLHHYFDSRPHHGGVL
jgi:hypothetical protein